MAGNFMLLGLSMNSKIITKNNAHRVQCNNDP